MELGQPLHAFDAAMIHGDKVVVRKAYEGEQFVTLDEVERKLSPNDLMICNIDEGMCIAGVFGGARSGVSNKTTNIFLESAHFNPQSVRKTSRFHGLQTDSSFRFERGADPNITVFALKRAAMLIKELAGGMISSEVVDVYPNVIAPVNINVRWNNINRLIGKEIGREAIKSILNDLGMEIVQETSDGIEVAVPTFKTDVTREADVIEEILRIYGYDNIEMTGQLRASLSFANKPDPEKLRNLLSDLLCNRGFFEVMNNSLTRSKYTDESPWLDASTLVRLMNPLSNDLNVMRQSLLFGGLETLAYNQNRKSNNLKIYEFGRVYFKTGVPAKDANSLSGYEEQEHLALWITGDKVPESWRSDQAKTDFFDLKESVHYILLRLGFDLDKISKKPYSDLLFEQALNYASGEKMIVNFGVLHKKEIKRFDLKQDVLYADFHWDNILSLISMNKTSYKGVPKFPEVRRDLALVLEQSVTYEDLEKAAYQAEKHLLKSVSLFDIYQGDKIGPGKKSYAMSFVLRDDEKTLTDQVIEKSMEKILHAFREKFQAVIR
jgi:phenylalanyl-tRNA synthetase beta chain